MKTTCLRIPWLSRLPAAITAPRGFLAAGVFCDLKRLGTGKGSEKGQKRDLALIVSETPATVAGLFTTNQVCAAPVKLSRDRAARPSARAIVANSGNANACTGAAGLRDAQAMTAWAAQLLGCAPADVLVGSTGRIGLRLPLANCERGVGLAVAGLGRSAAHGHHAAEAIMTTDTRPKEVAVEFTVGGRKVRLAGMCKGAGMIQPGMSLTGARPAAIPLHATMLCFLTTDAAVASAALRLALAEAVAGSFNRITVDGDMSTNDTVLILANGQAGNRRISTAPAGRRDFARFQTALSEVTLELAKMIVRDGEGVSHFVTLHVAGAVDFADADAAARAVANSVLVKTSWFGGDPNWGRVMDALGYAPARVLEEKVDLGYSRPGSRQVFWAVKRGQPTAVPLAALKPIVAQREFDLHLHLHLGRGRAVLYTADLTEAYVDFNKGE